MFDLTVNEYFEAIQNLSLDDFIIFYLTVYFFVNSIQHALGMAVGTDKLKTNPKIAASLILAYTFGIIRDLDPVDSIFPNPYLAIIIQAMILVICTWIFRQLIFSQGGIFQKLFSWVITFQAKKEAKRLTIYPPITTISKEDGNQIQQASKRSQKRLISHQHNFIINLGVSIILFCYVWSLSWPVGSIFLLFSGYFLCPYYEAIKVNIPHGSQFIKYTDT